MNIIEKMKSIIAGYKDMSVFSNGIEIDWLSDDGNFGLMSNGDAVIKTDILGNETHTHNFVLYARGQAIRDYQRIQNSTWLLEFGNWLKDQTGGKVELNGKSGEITDIKCSNALLYKITEQTNSVTYQLQIQAQYKIYD